MKVAIRNARIYDPASGREGDIGDVFVEEGLIVEGLVNPELDIDAEERVLMAGAIDANANIATYGFNFFRGCGLLPGLGDAARAYVRLGYTHLNEAFVTLQTARYVHYDLSLIPWLDTSMILSVPLYDLESLIRNDDVDRCAQILAAFGEISKSLGFRLFESELYYEQEIYSHRNISSDKLLLFFARVADALGLRFFVHPQEVSVKLACQYPENYHLSSVCELLAGNACAGLRHALDAGLSVDTGFFPRGECLRILPEQPEVPGLVFKFDIGLTHPVYFVLAQVERDTETDNLLKLLSTGNEYRVAFSIVPPARDLSENIAAIWSKIVSRFGLSYLARITRNVPAELLGLVDRGNLKIGSRADIAIYDIGSDDSPEEMKRAFSSCRYLFKRGEMVVSEGEIVGAETNKKTWYRKYVGSDREEALKILSQSSFRPVNLEIKEDLAGELEGLTLR